MLRYKQNICSFGVGVYQFSSNLPAPINEGSDPQTKSGSLTIEGNLTTGGVLTTESFKMLTGAGEDKVLTTDASGVASWQTPAGGATPGGSTGYVQFNNSGAFGADSNLFWDNTNKRLGIGMTDPSQKITLAGGNLLQTSANPTHAGSILDGEGGAELNDPYDVYVSGKYAYVVSKYGKSLEIIDISDPTNPTHISFIVDGGDALLYYPTSVFVVDKYAYVTATNDSTLEIIDISNPSNPTHAGSISNGEGGALLLYPYSVYVSGKYAYVAVGAGDALEIIDISNPSNPTHAGSISNGEGGALLNDPRDVYVLGDYAYIVSFAGDSLEIVDISDPTNPTHAGSIINGGDVRLNGPMAVYVSGKYAYVASNYSSSLEIIDISNPTNPTHASYASGMSSAKSVYVSGKYAYVVGSTYFKIVDVSDPNNPTDAGSISNGEGGALLSSPYSVYVSGKYAYVASNGSGALEIVDISGLDVPSANIGDLAVGTIDVWENASVNNNLYVGSGLNVGPRGIMTDGDIHATGDITATGSCCADYVFEDDYKLLTIYELEEYIKEYGHLPGMESDGKVSLLKQEKLLEKIEELTLYIIEQQKQIDELESQVFEENGVKSIF